MGSSHDPTHLADDGDGRASRHALYTFVVPDDNDPTREAPREAPSVDAETYALLVAAPAGVFTRALAAADDVTIGRGKECDIIIVDDAVSRVHARVRPGTPPTIEDLGSRNGTYVVGQRIAPGRPHPLAPGAVVEIGPTSIILQHVTAARAKPPVSPRVDPSSDVVIVEPSMVRLYKLLDVVAPSRISVLILGETGVGKEVYAEAIHRRSPSASAPFLRLNCAAVPESLLEGELFGHEKGAFTGANATKIGLLEAASGGTLFLDEVGEASAAAQAKLLRFLESGEILRIGSVKPRVVDARIVAATNRDLRTMIDEGTFRADLFFRLNGISMTLPPLRDRPAEIVPLAQRFLDRATRRLGKPSATLAASACARLLAHDWPGNVRELRSVMERATLFAGEAVDESHIQIDAPGGSRPTRAPAPAGDSARELGAEVKPPKSSDELAVLDAMARAGGNQRRAAQSLGIARGTLIKRLETFGIARPRKS